MQLDKKDFFEVVDCLIKVQIIVKHIVVCFEIRLRCIIICRSKNFIIKIIHILYHRLGIHVFTSWIQNIQNSLNHFQILLVSEDLINNRIVTKKLRGKKIKCISILYTRFPLSCAKTFEFDFIRNYCDNFISCFTNIDRRENRICC